MPREISEADWNAQGEALFGPDRMAWRFVCPVCKHIATPADWKSVGAAAENVAFSCIGRWGEAKREAFVLVTGDDEADIAAKMKGRSGDGPGPCNYAGGGLFRLNPVSVRRADGNVSSIFEFDGVSPDGTDRKADDPGNQNVPSDADSIA